MIKTYIAVIILFILAGISLWFDYHPKIQPSWSVKDIFMTYPPRKTK